MTGNRKVMHSDNGTGSGTRLAGWLTVLAGMLCTGPLAAQPDAAATPDFAACVAGLEDRARAAGISDAVVTGVLGNVERIERVIELDRKQPEFTQTFADYYNRRVTAERVEQGRQLLARHRTVLERVQRESGVPAHYLVSFWGLETNFGSYFGKMPVPDSLATLACDPRRSGFFADELMAALKIIDAGDIAADDMLGSWAGAMGHVQFLPSVFLKYARDGDGDGKRDLWGSVPDAMASAGSFLNHLGWQPGLRWGREVRLPDDFDYGLSGRGNSQPLSAWVDIGVMDVWGRALPRLPLPASVLVPAGHTGPAFIVYDNFDVIMRWNRSEYYALAVGRLADRIAGAGTLSRSPVLGDPVSREQVRQLQADLEQLGYDPGEPDGIFGPATRAALGKFQASRGLIADGHLDAGIMDKVREAASPSPE